MQIACFQCRGVRCVQDLGPLGFFMKVFEALEEKEVVPFF
ncbi:hypothetical protein NOC27_1771 [Nitrosococcus oceani AFC27]|nr:hypothetical protein NOC27_1771 [Nitrosococcus oceani AFC27]